jgi:alpha-galactosidase
MGMDFGLWVEPEMVNPDSDLYRAHPDWVIHFPTRDLSEMRNQLILNLAHSDVQDYLITHLSRLLSENNIIFIKWDMNRNVSEPGWADAPGDQRELWLRYVYGVYHVWETLADPPPQVVWQSCSGGGGRADLGILCLADQIWVSDNTHATARLGIQEGFSQIFPANTMEAWVTDAEHGSVPLRFKMHVSMCGSLGIGGHLLRWSEEDRAEAAHWIAVYKRIRHIIQFGDLYRLRSAQQDAVSALQYVTKDQSESVAFVFRTFLSHPAQMPMLYLKGLTAEAIYEDHNTGERKSGAAWMYAGLLLRLDNIESQVLHLQRL